MTDTTNMFNTIVSTCRQFDSVLQALHDIQDRIAADSNLSGQLAAKAATVGRTDLAASNFDNLNLAIQALQNHLNTNSGSVTPPFSDGGTVKLAYYQIM